MARHPVEHGIGGGAGSQVGQWGYAQHGGLLTACAPEATAEVLATFHATGFAEAAVIGQLGAGQPGVLLG